jgi:ribosome-binding factor A
MLFKKNNFIQQRKKSFYEREISQILYKIVKEHNLPSLSLSYCELSARGESIKIYLSFSQAENKEKIISLINKKYSSLIKQEMAKSKKFTYLPNLIFLLDKELETINNLEKILQKFNIENEN